MNRLKRRGTDIRVHTIRAEKCASKNAKIEAIFRENDIAQQSAHDELAKVQKTLEGLRKKLDGRLNGDTARG